MEWELRARDKEIFHQQQAHIQAYVMLGDHNNRHFYATIQGRREKIKILHVIDANSRWLPEPQEIQKEIVRIYQGLLGTANTQLTHVNYEVCRYSLHAGESPTHKGLAYLVIKPIVIHLVEELKQTSTIKPNKVITCLSMD